MPLVEPIDGEDMAALAQTLLSLADHPREVVYVPGDNLFSVSDEVADRYLAVLSPQETPPEPAKKAVPAKKATAKKEG